MSYKIHMFIASFFGPKCFTIKNKNKDTVVCVLPNISGKKRAMRVLPPAFCAEEPVESHVDTGKHVDQSSTSSTEVIESVFKRDRLSVTAATSYTTEQAGAAQTT